MYKVAIVKYSEHGRSVEEAVKLSDAFRRCPKTQRS